MIEQFRRHVATISSEGTQFIEQGRFGEAVELYSSGLSWIKAAAVVRLNNHAESEGENTLSSSLSPDSCTEDDYVVPQLRFAQQRSPPLPCTSYPGDGAGEDEQQLFIHQKPLEFSDDERYSYDQACLVLIYNLALSYHLSATACTTKQEDEKANLFSKRALALWPIVYRLHCREGMGVTNIHTCSILNNLGQLYHVLKDSERSRHCFISLLTVMHSLEGSCDPDLLSTHATFMNNVMSLVAPPDTTIAPAA